MKLIVGLGNPGREYAATRHNAGFMVIDRLAPKLGADVTKKMFKALVGQGRVGDEKVILAKPQTFMNLSGEAVGALLHWYKLTAAGLIVVYDDLDLPPGKLRVRPGGGSGGHKGMQSIIGVLGTENFPRVRIGIGKPAVPGIETAGYVLGRFGGEEAKEVGEALDLAAEALCCIVREGVDRAMNLYNRR
jgi:PTH1 family peptidyl-tRNA hydrolase